MRTNRLAALSTIALVTVVVTSSALSNLSADSWHPPRPVTIEGEGSWGNVFPSLLMWDSASEKGELHGLLLRDGDYLGSDALLFPYFTSDGTELKVASNEWSAQLADKIVAVSLKQADGLEWLEKASQQELAGIRFIDLPDDLDVASLPSFQRLAAANPSVGIGVKSRDTLLRILPLFQPRALFIDSGESIADIREVLAKQKRLETLSISAKDFGSLDFLPALPGLRRLVIGDWDVEAAGPLPAGMSRLKSLIVNGVKDLSALRAAPAGLEELSVSGSELTDLTGLAELPGLRTLILNCDNWNLSRSPRPQQWTDLSSLESLKQLRWLGLPPNTTQEQFATIVRTHPDLEILEMAGGENVIDLAPLSELKGLKALVLVRPHGNLEMLQGLKSLRFVGVPQETVKESPEQVTALRKALPDALIVPLCLGSGWILLLVPAIALFWFFEPRLSWTVGNRPA